MAEGTERAGTSSTPQLSLVLAVLNEQASLPELFRRLRALSLPPWEAIVADDGSTDGTREYLAELARNDPRVRLLFHDGRQTTVTAQSAAIASARGPSVVVMDADLQHPPELVPALLGGLEEGAALVVASRYLPGGTPGARPPLRAVISRGAEWTAKLLLAPARQLTDPVSGYFAFRRSVFVPLPPGTRGYKLLLFLLVMSRGRPVREVPFRFEPRTAGSSKVTSGLAFVRLFLVEVLLARRFSRRLTTSTVAAARPAGS